MKRNKETEEFRNGGRRDSREGKGRFDLIPVDGLKRVADRYQKGAKEYGERNWEQGIPTTRSYDSAMRHLTQWMRQENKEDHLAAVVWNIFSMMRFEGTEFDDRPDRPE